MLRAHEDATADEIAHLCALFLNQQALLENLAGCLAIVEPGQVRIRKG